MDNLNPATNNTDNIPKEKTLRDLMSERWFPSYTKNVGWKDGYFSAHDSSWKKHEEKYPNFQDYLDSLDDEDFLDLYNSKLDYDNDLPF